MIDIILEHNMNKVLNLAVCLKVKLQIFNILYPYY